MEKVYGVLTQASVERGSVLGPPEPGRSLGRSMEVFVAGSVQPLVGRHPKIHSLIDLAAQKNRHPYDVHNGVAGGKSDPAVAVKNAKTSCNIKKRMFNKVEYESCLLLLIIKPS